MILKHLLYLGSKNQRKQYLKNYRKTKIYFSKKVILINNRKSKNMLNGNSNVKSKNNLNEIFSR